MKPTALVFLLLIPSSCQIEPESLNYGSDACYTCKMTLMDKKFGAELVTNKGKVFKFDDINCMLNFYNAGELSHDEYSYRLVADFGQPNKLIDARDAFYLKSSVIKTPMASKVAAFETKESMEAVKNELDGIYLVWGELVSQFK
jgi:copper chaperone NosL